MESGNWRGLAVLIESRLEADRFLDRVDSWPEKVFFRTATPLAMLLSREWPELTDDLVSIL
jgi:hypothetical protein